MLLFWQPILTASSDHCFHTCPSVPTFSKSRKTKQFSNEDNDRYWRDFGSGRRHYWLQLSYSKFIGVTSLFIASKIEEIYPPKLTDFAYVTDGACNESDILKMELVLLKTLNWGLSPMTPNAWVRMFMQLATKERENEEFVIPRFSGLPFINTMRLLDLVTMDMGSLSYSYSVLAASAICHLQSREKALAASGYKWGDIAQCVGWMSVFVTALKEVNSPLCQKSFPNIPLDNQHNIQTHSLELSVLERAQELAQIVKKNMESPEHPAMLNKSINLVTPPEQENDVRLKTTPRSNMATVPFGNRNHKIHSVFFNLPDTPTI